MIGESYNAHYNIKVIQNAGTFSLRQQIGNVTTLQTSKQLEWKSDTALEVKLA